MNRDTPPKLEASSIQVPHGQGVQVGDNNVMTNNFRIHLDAPIVSTPAYRETMRVIKGRTRVLRDRDDEMAQLCEFAMGRNYFESSNYLWIIGDAWAGKTALLAEAVQAIPGKHKIDIVAYFLIGRESQASREQFLIAIISQLCSLLEVAPPPTVDVHAYRDLWARAVLRAKKEKRYLLLVVDGLDEDLRPGGHSVAALLPTEHLSPHARVLVTSRPHPALPYDVDASHPLRTAGAVKLPASPHGAERKTLAEQEINALLSSEPNGTQHSSDIPFDVLGLLTAASGGLSVQDIAAMTKSNPRHVRAFITERAARSLQPVGLGRVASEPRYQFAHQTLLEYCRINPDVGQDPRYREMIFEWADEWSDRNWPTMATDNIQTPLYLLDSYPAMLAGQEGLSHRQPKLKRLANLVSDVGWIDAALTEVGAGQVVAALRVAHDVVPVRHRNSVADMLRLVEHLPKKQWAGPRESYPTHTVEKLARGAVTSQLSELGKAAGDRIRRYPPPYTVPVWVDGRTAVRQADSRFLHDGAIRAVAFCPDGRVVSGGSVDGTVRLWDPATPCDGGCRVGHHESVVLTVAVTTGGLIASGGLDGVVRLWDPATPDKRGRELGRHMGAVRALAVTPDGHLASGGADGTVRLWDPTNPSHPGCMVARHEAQIRGLAATSDGRIVSGGLDGAVRLWDPASPDYSGLELGRHQAVMAMTVTLDDQIMSVGLGGEVRLWDRDNPGTIRNELNCRSAARTVAATANGRTVCGCADGVIRLWDHQTANDRSTAVADHRGTISALAVSPDGWIAAANDDVLTIFELAY